MAKTTHDDDNDMDYSQMFSGELAQLDDQYNKTNSLYDRTDSALNKNLERMNAPIMHGGSSPYRDISDLSKSLGSIRQTALSITHEKISAKKTIAELQLKAKANEKNSGVDALNDTLLREMLIKMGNNPAIIRVKPSEINNKGEEELKNLDPERLGINANDLESVRRFKKSCGDDK